MRRVRSPEETGRPTEDDAIMSSISSIGGNTARDIPQKNRQETSRGLLQSPRLRTEYTKDHSVTNKCRTVLLEERVCVTGGRSVDEDLNGERRTGGFSIQHQPAVPGTYPMISFTKKLRMAQPPHHLAQGFLRARSPVRPNAEVAFASRPQREDAFAAVVSGDLNVPIPYKPQETHAQRCR